MEDPGFILQLVGLFLTLMVLVYLFAGDNALFRIVTYTFVGLASGYVTVLIIFQVLMPRFFNLLRTGSPLLIGFGMIPFVLGLLLLFKLSPRLSSVGTLPMAVLVGVGAAVAVGGAIFGTLFGQIAGTVSLFNVAETGSYARLLEGIFVLLGTISTLAYFQFSARRRPSPVAPAAEAAESLASETTETPAAPVRRASGLEVLAKIGQVFIGITLGAMFAGVYTAAITALIERLGFVIDTVTSVIGRPF
jgi:hypothetical protein